MLEAPASVLEVTEVALESSDPSVTKVTEREKMTPRRLSQQSSSLAPLNSYLAFPAAPPPPPAPGDGLTAPPPPSGPPRRRDRAAPLPTRRPRYRCRSPQPPPELGVRRSPLTGPLGFPRSGAEGAAGPEPRCPRRGREALQGDSARSYPLPPEVRARGRRDRRAEPTHQPGTPPRSQPLRSGRGWRGPPAPGGPAHCGVCRSRRRAAPPRRAASRGL